MAEGDSGELLSEYLPGLRIGFPDGVVDASTGSSRQWSLWGLSFVLVALLTCLGAYLL
jgi:hypothetical protein